MDRTADAARDFFLFSNCGNLNDMTVYSQNRDGSPGRSIWTNPSTGFPRSWTAEIVLIVMVAAAFLSGSGCRITSIDSARRAAQIASIGSKPLVKVKRLEPARSLDPISQLIVGRPDPSPRTQLFLRKNNLAEKYEVDPARVVDLIQEECLCKPDMATFHAIAELAKLEADWKLRTRKKTEAAAHYITAVIHAYQFLFDPQLDIQRNAYDPQFREICDIYNRSLESLLRIVCNSTDFQPGARHQLSDQGVDVEFDVVIDGRWKQEEFERFELVNDFQVGGLENKYHTYGLGVPLIAIRKREVANASAFEKYYPPSLALPMTAFCDVLSLDNGDDGSRVRAVITLYDPLEKTVANTKTRNAPLESDLSAPLAYYLNDPLLNTDILATVSLVNAEIANEYYGFYMLEPFDPEKIPVVMVHGLWSNPVTWMKMFNDLRANPWIRRECQFWFYMYPTGQPFWISAANMRDDLKNLRNDVDPENQSRGMQEMILVGHSMGGLLSRMQTVDSGDDFWNIVSKAPLEEVKGSPETLERIRGLFYFEADPVISRVVTIASPHRGSSYANTVTRWLSHQVFKMPKMLTTRFSEFVNENQSILRNTRHLRIPTSVDSLSPESPFIQALLSADNKHDVIYHNIYGNTGGSSLPFGLGNDTPGDGVVSVESARLEYAVSELEVPAEHMEVHQHPESILEVRRILIEQLVNTGRMPAYDDRVKHVSHGLPDHDSTDLQGMSRK